MPHLATRSTTALSARLEHGELHLTIPRNVLASGATHLIRVPVMEQAA